MELRVLRYFLTAVNEGNITRAADILHVTQPTLSRQLIELENELGATLLIRGKRSLTLTDDGMLFKQQAEEIVELADKAEQTFTGKNEAISGVISLGASEALGGRVLARYMKQFLKKYPDVRFDLYNEMADNIKDKLEKGLLDLGLLLEPVDTKKYEFLRLSQKESWGILLRKDHPLAKKDKIYVQDLREYPLILPKRENARNEARNSGRTAINKSSSIRPEINVLGMTVDEAVSQLDKFIDDACLANLGQITVIHGKGTGALRKGIHNYLKTLKKQKRISGYRDGEFGEGDMGVTVIML